MTAITIGAPKSAVTELILNSIGANKVLAIKSQPKQNIAPPKKQTGITIRGLAVFKSAFTIWGTATPTKDTGPANAVTQAHKMLEVTTKIILKLLILTPMFCA